MAETQLEKLKRTELLPPLEDLYDDIEAQKYISEVSVYLNQEPKEAWIKNHPFAKEVRYVPIERLEFLMSYFFGQWKVEIRDTKLLANSLVVSVRVHYRNVLKLSTDEWLYTDGIGAVPVQVDKGADVTDPNAIKSNAIQIGLPAAESYAFKDAVEKLGRIFGKDLNRKEMTSYEVLLGTEASPRFPAMEIPKETSAPDLNGEKE